MTVFQKILDRKIPARIVHEDEHCLAFHDIAPQAPVHILIIPKKPLAMLSEATVDDVPLLGHLCLQSRIVAEKLGLEDFRIVINNGSQAGQTVFHLHLHLLAGRPLGWPPG